MDNVSQETMAVLIIASLIALVVGFFIGRATKGADNNAQSALSDVQKQLDDYKQEVSEHFGKTADLVDNLTQSYKDVFDHLGSSAKTLLSEEQVNKHIASRADKAITLTYAGEAAQKVVDIVETTTSEQSEGETAQKVGDIVENTTPEGEAKATQKVDDSSESPQTIAAKANSKTDIGIKTTDDQQPVDKVATADKRSTSA